MNNIRVIIRKQKLTSDWTDLTRLISRFYSSEKTVKEGKTEGGQEYAGEKHEWNILKVFSSQKNSFLELHRYGPFQASMERLKMWKTRMERDADLMDQRFIKERHSILGNDLATAHFIVFRGGKVKFIGQADWIKKEMDDDNFQKLPKRFIEGWLLEAVDASELPLRYEAFKNLKGLYELRTLILRDCPNIDDWCVDRISGEFQDTLEHLDLSGCGRITERSLTCLYRCKKLKTLVLDNIVKSRTFEYSCLLLEDSLPQLTIKGVNYLEISNAQENNN